MAKMYHFSDGESGEFGCYSERGLMCYLMFVCLPNPTKLREFLHKQEFLDDMQSPFDGDEKSLTGSIIFSELDFGKRYGFGCPDGAIFVGGDQPRMLFIETKLNESYHTSCRTHQGEKYNSSIQGQLELRWRLNNLFAQKSELPDVDNNYPFNAENYVVETRSLMQVYAAKDKFYDEDKSQRPQEIGSWRHVQISDGVEFFLEKLGECNNRVFFCAITQDPPEENPFTNPANKEFLPRCGGIEPEFWDKAKHQFCWMSAEKLVEFTEPIRISPHA